MHRTFVLSKRHPFLGHTLGEGSRTEMNAASLTELLGSDQIAQSWPCLGMGLKGGSDSQMKCF